MSVKLFPAWILLVILACRVFPLFSQTDQIDFNRFSDQQGLPNNLVRLIYQDREGVLWIGGFNGLVRYDGYSMKSYRHNIRDSTSLSGSVILAIYEDSRGRLWIGSHGKGVDVSTQDKSSFSRVHLLYDTTGTKGLNVLDITEDSLGQLWMATSEGLILVKEDKRGFLPIELKKTMGDAFNCDFPVHPTTLMTGKDGKIWIGAQNGLYVWDESNHTLLCPEDFDGLAPGPVEGISYDRLGRVWIGCPRKHSRLFYEDETTGKFKSFNGIPFDTSFRGGAFTFDLDNRIWVSVFGDQLYGYDFRDSSVFLRSSQNSDIGLERFIRVPYVDLSGKVWLPCEALYTYSYPKGFRSYHHPYNFPQDVNCFFETVDYFWIGYREQGLVRLSKKNGETELFSSTLKGKFYIPSDLIVNIRQLKNGHLMLAGFDTIMVMDTMGLMLHSYRVAGTNRYIFQDSKDRIWVGSIGGLHLFSEKKGILKTYIPSELNGDARSFIQGITEDKDGNIWFASGLKGLTKLDPDTGLMMEFRPAEGDTSSLPSVVIQDLVFDQNNMLWLATDVALVSFDPVTFRIKSYDSSFGIASDYISSVVSSRDGMIWVSTLSGISSFDPVTHQFVNYSSIDGLSNTDYAHRSRYYGRDGTIYFGGKNGVDYFNPSRLRLNPTVPVMGLVSFNAVNKGITKSYTPADGVVRLSYDDDLVEIEFTGIHFSDQKEIKYMYRMDPIHDDWIDIGFQHSVLFSNLKPGDYIFRARAMTPDNIMSKEDLVIRIYIAPPFYQTSWFRILILMIIAGMIFYYIKYRELNISRKQKRESEINRKITELEKRALQAQMNPHFIYNSMNSIQQFMILHDVEGAMKYLTKFSRILRTVLNMSSQNTIPLSEEIKLIEDYLELENMRFPNKFTYAIIVSPELNIHSIEIPPFFIQPQVENAIRHGLLKKPSPGHLVIEIKSDSRHLLIRVEDNGIGREASMAAKYQDALSHDSKGLSIVEERLKHLHSDDSHLPFRIVDLYDPSHNPAGTRVDISLPID
ncbi:MAG TPA: two-component regulator propeller domain-containing protein [Saprospiraceae bacterium]|nr:two-component regulator propeller domain-containing protein [Saprospiraceae bacterium]